MPSAEAAPHPDGSAGERSSQYSFCNSSMTLMNKTLLPLFAIAATVSVLGAGCASAPEHVLALIGESDTISVGDFRNSWNRMRQAPPENMEQREEFLDLLVDYRVKLKEAKSRGIDRLPDVTQEIDDYRDELAVTWLLDDLLVEPGIRTLYERRKEEFKFSHVLIRWHRFAEGYVDTAATRKAALEILDKALSGAEPFDTLIARYSEDPQKRRNQGTIGWIIAGTSLPQVDDIVYEIAPGTVYPELMPSFFGFHVIKLIGREKARQRVRASQILFRLDVNNPLDTAAGFARMSLILDSLKRGKATFEDLARRNSMDPASGAKGGDLGWLEKGMNLEPMFETALFNVKPGEVSPVVRSAFGLHIVKVVEEAAARTLDEQRSDLRGIYHRERFDNDYDKLMTGLKTKYEYKFNPNVASRILTRLDSAWTTSTPGWDTRLNTQDREAFLFTLRGEGVPFKEIIPQIKRDPELQMRRFPQSSLDSIASLVADRHILVRESKGLEERNPEFKALVREFRESAWISRLEQEEVWKRVTVADEEARAYWEKHRADFRWPDRVGFSEIYVYSETHARRLLDSLKAGASFADLASRHTRRTGMFDRGGSWGLQPIDKNELSRAASLLEIGDVSAPITQDPGVSIVKLDSRDPAREKTWEEARSEAMARAREEAIAARMREWTGELRKRFKADVYTSHLKHTIDENK